jgi:hypothetical protein
MSAEKTENVCATSAQRVNPGPPHEAAESSQSSSVDRQDAAQRPIVGPQQNLAGSADDAEGI